MINQLHIPADYGVSIVRLGALTPEEWLENQSIKPAIMCSGSILLNGKPMEAVAERGIFYGDRTAIGFGSTREGLAGFGTFSDICYEFLTGYPTLVEDGQICRIKGSADPIFAKDYLRVGIGIHPDGEIYIVHTYEPRSITEFATRCEQNNFQTALNLNGGKRGFVYYEGNWELKSSERFLYNAIVAYKPEDWQKIRNYVKDAVK